VGTFWANIFRIATICIIGLRVGNQAAIHFHDYLGEFFFITWLIAYIAVIFFGPRITLKLIGRMQKPQQTVRGLEQK
jgi:exosortase/archaeosortase family protein